MDKSGTEVYAEYDNFSVSDEANDYYITYRKFTDGGAGDGLRNYGINRPFTTIDRDNDNNLTHNCAEVRHGAWWYGECGYASINQANIYWNELSNTYDKSTMRIMSC